MFRLPLLRSTISTSPILTTLRNLTTRRTFSSLPNYTQQQQQQQQQETEIDTLQKNKTTVQASAPPTAISELNLHPTTIRILKAKGFETLFPIQAAAFKPIREGKDVVGRASKTHNLSTRYTHKERVKGDAIYMIMKIQ